MSYFFYTYNIHDFKYVHLMLKCILFLYLFFFFVLFNKLSLFYRKKMLKYADNY